MLWKKRDNRPPGRRKRVRAMNFTYFKCFGTWQRRMRSMPAVCKPFRICPRRIQPFGIGWIALCLMLFVGCSAPQQAVRVEYVRVKPPIAVLTPCQYPSFKIETNQDLITALSLLIEAYTSCEAKVDAMIEIFNDEEENETWK